MSSALGQIRAVLSPYLSDATGLESISEDLMTLLEDADGDARNTAEIIEGLLALYAGNKISENVLKDNLTAALETKNVSVPQSIVVMPPADEDQRERSNVSASASLSGVVSGSYAVASRFLDTHVRIEYVVSPPSSNIVSEVQWGEILDLQSRLVLEEPEADIFSIQALRAATA